MMLAPLKQLSRQAGLLSKCLLGGAKSGTLSHNSFTQLKPLRRYKSNAPIGSHVIGVDLRTMNSCLTATEGSRTKVIENVEGSRTAVSVGASTPDGERDVGILARYRTILDAKNPFHTSGRIIGLDQGRWNNMQQVRCFHAKGSKVRYLDFRYRFNTCHIRSHLLIIRRQKMKKHQKRKWRRKYKSVIAKTRLKREIAKEKTFRVELLTMIKRAEQFDPREYALKKIQEINSRPKEITREERLEQLKQLIRENRYQVTYVKPKHRRIEI